MRSLIVFAAFVGLTWMTRQAVLADLIVGTFDGARSGQANIANGSLTTQLRTSLLSHFPEASFATSNTLTSAFLSGVDVLILGPSHELTGGIVPLSASEQLAMVNYVLAGGNAFLIADGYWASVTAANSMTSPFGVNVVDDGVTGFRSCTALLPNHPIFSGPFGTQMTFYMLGAGVLSSLGPNATSLAKMDSLDQSVLAVIDRDVLGPGSGRVVIYSDATLFADPGVADGFFVISETLFLNTFAYVVPEPSGIVMGGVGLTVGVVRRRPRRTQPLRS